MERDQIRLNSVRRIDPHVAQIVDSANRTALYSYELEKSWSKTDVEGTLMVYSRAAPPHHMVTIINRLNKSNFIEPLTSACDLQVKPPYLLFRNTKGLIYGIWFSEADDVPRIGNAIQENMKDDVTAAPQPAASDIMADPAVAVAGAPGGDIISMLSRAHGEFESKRQEPRSMATGATQINNDLVKPSPLRVQAGEQNTVADFFAKVSGAQAGGTIGGTGLPSPSSTGPVDSSGNATSGTHPVLQKLFQGAVAVGGQAMVQLPAGANVQNQQGGTNPIPIPGSGGQTHHPSTLSSSVPGAPISLQELEGRFKDNLRMSNQAKDEDASQLNPHLKAQQSQPHLYTQQQYQPSEPSLLSPQVFTSSRTCEPSLHETPPTDNVGPRNFPGLLTPGNATTMDMRPLNGSQESLHDGITSIASQITPLTQEQTSKDSNLKSYWWRILSLRKTKGLEVDEDVDDLVESTTRK
ncbi:mRNA-decapping enzyme 1A-like [Macrobrachium nipponense]|uniref:mRNA-decapping enzyme 1A-like n=1 Tax=Macrobrachium nipponense TaxID=159736 RepID=UPI0030C7DFC2